MLSEYSSWYANDALPTFIKTVYVSRIWFCLEITDMDVDT